MGDLDLHEKGYLDAKQHASRDIDCSGLGLAHSPDLCGS
jgi:hypothetical protein